MVTLRRLVATLLLAIFGLPVLLSSLATGQGTEAGLPACCRRTGQHHCAMSMGQHSAADNATANHAWKEQVAQCPYCPACPALGTHVDLLFPQAATLAFGHEFGLAATVRRAEGCRRIAREKARGKRGPPSPHFA